MLSGKHARLSLKNKYVKVEGMARHVDQLLAPAEGFDLCPRFFWLFGQRKGLIMLFLPILGHFWCSVVTLVTFSSNLINFEKT